MKTCPPGWLERIRKRKEAYEKRCCGEKKMVGGKEVAEKRSWLLGFVLAKNATGLFGLWELAGRVVWGA